MQAKINIRVCGWEVIWKKSQGRAAASSCLCMGGHISTIQVFDMYKLEASVALVSILYLFHCRRSLRKGRMKKARTAEKVWFKLA